MDRTEIVSNAHDAVATSEYSTKFPSPGHRREWRERDIYIESSDKYIGVGHVPYSVESAKQFIRIDYLFHAHVASE